MSTPNHPESIPPKVPVEKCDCGCAAAAKTWKWILPLIIGLVVADVFAAPPVITPPPTPAESATAITAPGAEKPASLPKLLDLGASKCIPCKMMAPILEELKTSLAGQLEVQFIDVWQDRAAGTKYGIESIPTQIFYDAQGNELFRHSGFFSRAEILAKWQELGISLVPAAAPPQAATPAPSVP